MKDSSKRLLLIALILLSIVPIFFFCKLPTAWTLQATELYIGTIAGYIGITLLLWMYTIGTKSVMGLLFNDLAPVLRIHSWIGKYGTVLIFAHPILLTLSFGQSLFYSIWPGLASYYDRQVMLGTIALYVLLLVWVTSALLRNKMAYRPWKYLHYLGYLALPFALLHIPNIGERYAAQLPARLYFFAVVIGFFIFTLLRLRTLFNLDKAPYEIVSHKAISSDVYLVTLRPTGDQIVRPRNGQYVYLKVGIISEDHPFSVAHINEATGEIVIAYRVFGRYTNYFSSLPSGTRVQIGGPYGNFTSEISAKPTVFIAGGIGITPFLSHIMERSPETTWLFYANRTHESATFTQTLTRQLGAHLVSIYSREPAAAGEESGYLSSDTLAKYLPAPSDCDYFICGPTGMITASIDALHALGVPASSIYSERFDF